MKTSTKTSVLVALLAGALFLTHPADAATRTWTSGGSGDFWSTPDNWSAVGAPTSGDDVLFGNTDALGTTSTETNNIVDASFTNTVRSLKYGQTNSLHRTEIQAPNLTISSGGGVPYALYVGSGAEDGATPKNFTTIVGKALTLNSPGGDIRIHQGSATSGVHYAVLDLKGLDTFKATVQRLLIAYEDDSQSRNRRPGAWVFMARTNYITCTYPGLGYQIAHVVQQGGQAATNRLGQVNVFNVQSMRFGGAKTANTKVDFNTGWENPSATFRNIDSTSRQSTWYIGDDATSGSSGQCTAFVDFSRGTVDALVDTIYVGRGQSANTAYNAHGNGTLTFDRGTIDVNTLEIGYQLAAGSSVGKGVVNVLTNGLLKVNQSLRLARDLGPGASALPANSVATLTINGGTLHVAGDIVDGGGISSLTISNGGAVNLQPPGDAAPGNIGVGTLNFGGGTLTNFAVLSLSNLNVLDPDTSFTVQPGQGLSPIARGIRGTLTFNPDLVLTNARLYFDLADSFSANDRISVNGGLTLRGTNLVEIVPAGAFGAGTYTLMTYGTTLSGNETNLKVTGPAGDSRYTVAFDVGTVPNVNLNVSGGPSKSLTWSGDGSGNVWNLKGARNWNDGGGANIEKFYNLDAVSFDDSGSANPAINLVGTLLPASVAVSGTKSYTFSGSGRISGPASLAHNSSGTLLILTTNDFTGNTDLNAGTLQLGDGATADGALGTGLLFNNTALIFNAAIFQNVANTIYGNGSIVKRGPGVTRLSGISYFTSPMVIESGTLQAGIAGALGDTSAGTTNLNGGTLDLGGQNLGAEPVFTAGSGVGGAGAIINSGPLGGSLQNVTLFAPTTFGGTASWSISPSSSSDGLLANSNKVTKVGANLVGLTHASSSFVSETGLGELDIQAGVLSLQGYVNVGDPTLAITIRTNATLEVANTGDNLAAKPIVMDGGACILSRIPNIALPQYCNLSGPIALGGRAVFDMVSGATLILNGEVSGTGPFVKGVGYHPASAATSTGSGTVILGASNSFTGDLRVETGTLVLTNDASVTKAASIVMAGGTLEVSRRTDGALTLASGQSLKGAGNITGNLLSPAGTTVSPGESIGALNINGDVTLRGSTTMEVGKTATTLFGDQLNVTGTLDLGGTLTVTYSGDTPATGDKFPLFSAGALANSFTTVTFPDIPHVVWTNLTGVDGSIEVLSAPSEPAEPPTLNVVVSGNNLTLAWALDYTSYILQGQTNPVSIGLSTNWGAVPGVVANQVVLPVVPANGCTFFRLIRP